MWVLQLPVVIPLGDKWGPWDTPEAAKTWVLGHNVDAQGRSATLRVETHKEVFGGRGSKRRRALTAQGWNALTALVSLKNALAKQDELAMKNLLPRLFALYEEALAARCRKPDELIDVPPFELSSNELELLRLQQSKHERKNAK